MTFITHKPCIILRRFCKQLLLVHVLKKRSSVSTHSRPLIFLPNPHLLKMLKSTTVELSSWKFCWLQQVGSWAKQKLSFWTEPFKSSSGRGQMPGVVISSSKQNTSTVESYMVVFWRGSLGGQEYPSVTDRNSQHKIWREHLLQH